MYIFRVVIMLFFTLQNEDFEEKDVFIKDILPRNTSEPYDELV